MHDDHDATRYGRSFADVYDQWYVSAFDTDAALARLRELTGDGRVLELGAGTGRLARPLGLGGLDVVALDSSSAMLERLRTHGDTSGVTTVEADMAALDSCVELAGRTFDTIVCACSSILNLPDRRAIGRCIAGAAQLLAPGGALVLEVIVPADPSSIPRRSLTPADVTSERPVFVETVFDPSTGRLHGRHIEVADDDVIVRPWNVVLCPVEQFDAFARAAGLVLRDRWSDWEGSPFDEDSSTHVSVWRSPT